LPVPEHVSPQTADLLKGLILGAYVDTYRTGMAAAAVAAILTVAIALRFLPARVTPGLVRK
jgi:hypothetical protein